MNSPKATLAILLVSAVAGACESAPLTEERGRQTSVERGEQAANTPAPGVPLERTLHVFHNGVRRDVKLLRQDAKEAGDEDFLRKAFQSETSGLIVSSTLASELWGYSSKEDEVLANEHFRAMTGTPARGETSSLSKPAHAAIALENSGRITFYTDVNYGGEVYPFDQPTSGYQGITNVDWVYNDKFSMVHLFCMGIDLYEHANGGGKKLVIHAPPRDSFGRCGSAPHNLTDYSFNIFGTWNDKVSSYDPF